MSQQHRIWGARAAWRVMLLGALVVGVPADALADDTEVEEAAAEPPVGQLRLGGALRFSYYVKSWDELNQSRGGDFRFDVLRLNTGLQYGKLIAASDYRFYGIYGHYMKYGWMGAQLDEHSALKLGAVKVPFGLMPYASHSWFFNLGYYVGLEDDHDLGLLYTYDAGGWDIDVAYLHSDEGTFSGNSLDSARYAYDLVRVEEVRAASGRVTRAASSQKEQHAGALRVQKTLSSGAGDTVLGAGGQAGGIFNELTLRYGSRWSASAFVKQTSGPLEVSGQVIRAERRLVDAPASLEGAWMGAFDSPYRVARAFTIAQGNVAWTFPVDRELLSSVQVYNDLSLMLKDEGAPTIQSITGALLSSSHVYTYVDLALGRNQPWVGGDWESGLAEGDPDAPWEARLNINIGLYYDGILPLL